MPDPGLLDVLRRSGGLVAVARQLQIAPPVALAAATALLPLVRAGFRRDVEQAESLAAGLSGMLIWLEELGGGALASAVLQNDGASQSAGEAIVARIFGPALARQVVAEAAAQSDVPAETVAKVLPLLAMLSGGYVSARAGHMSGAERLAELGPLLDLEGVGNPLDALVAIADD
jgi:hypothetical protein